jgi:WD40 repeat protein
VLVRLRTGPGRFIYVLRFSPDGSTLFAAIAVVPDFPATIRRFNARSGRPLGRERQIGRGSGNVRLMLTRDGRRLVTTRFDGATVISDARTLRPQREGLGAAVVRDWKAASRRFSGHAGRVEWQSMSPDGRMLATGSTDGTVRLWDLATQQPPGAALSGLPEPLPTFPVHAGRRLPLRHRLSDPPTAGTCARPHGHDTPAP